MKKIVRLTESQLVSIVRRIIKEDEPEPVHTGDKYIVSFAFDEGESKVSKATKQEVIKFLDEKLPSTMETIHKFIDSKYKLPKLFEIHVGTSHTGGDQINVQVKRNREAEMMRIISELLKKYNILGTRVEQLVTFTEKTYQPSNLDVKFFDPKKVRPNDKERFGEIIFYPIETVGLEKPDLFKSAGMVQPELLRFSDKRGFWDKLLDLDFNDRSYYAVNQKSILDGILKLQSYSDVEELNSIIEASKKMSLDSWINKNVSDQTVMNKIFQHLRNIFGKATYTSDRQAPSRYQIQQSNDGSIYIDGL